MSKYKVIGLGLEEQPSGQSFSEEANAQLWSYIRNNVSSDSKFAVYGAAGVPGKPIISELDEYGLAGLMTAHYDMHHHEFTAVNKHPEYLIKDNDVRHIVVCASKRHYSKIVRFIISKVNRRSNIILPFAEGGEWPIDEFDNPKPLVFVSFSCFGSKRVFPILGRLLTHLERNDIFIRSAETNTRYIANIASSGEGSGKPLQRDVDEHVYHRIKAMDFYEYCTVHDFFALDALDDFKDINVVVHLRDPRDVVASYYHRLFGKASDVSDGLFIGEQDEKLKEERLLMILGGGVFQHYDNYFLIWPSIRDMVANLVSVQRFSHMRYLRFEEVHAKPRESFRELMRWLDYDRNPLFDITDNLLDEAIELGSFEHQTRGTRKRGENHNHVYMKDGLQTSCRKGVTGDWKNHFTPAVKARFKEMAGEGLIQLGYEKDMNW